MFSDDHAVQAIGAYGGRFEKEDLAPNLDALARVGMVFDRCYFFLCDRSFQGSSFPSGHTAPTSFCHALSRS